LFYSLALFLFYLALEEDRPLFMLAALVCLGLAARERLLALFFVPVAGGYLALLYLPGFERPRGLHWRNLATLAVPGAAGAAVLAGPYLLNLGDWLSNFGWSKNSPVWTVAGTLYYTGPAVAGLAALGAAHHLARRSRAALLLTVGAVTPLAALAVLAPFQYTASRYAFVSLTSWIGLAGLGLALLFHETRGRRLALAAAALAAAVAVPAAENYLYFRYQNGNREDARAAFQYIAARKQPGDRVVAANRYLGQYYLGEPVGSLRLFDPETIPAGTRRVWFVEDMTSQEVAPEALAWVKAHADEAANFDVRVRLRTFTMRVYRFEAAPAASP
jgi:hypothetical protein